MSSFFGLFRTSCKEAEPAYAVMNCDIADCLAGSYSKVFTNTGGIWKHGLDSHNMVQVTKFQIFFYQIVTRPPSYVEINCYTNGISVNASVV